METKKLISLIKETVDSNTVLPVLENVKIEDNILTATDLGITLEVPNIDIKGKGLIYYKDFINTIEAIKDCSIKTLSKNRVRIFNKTESVEIAMSDIKDFPKNPDVSKSKRIHIIDPKDYEKILIAQDFVSNDDLRPAMKCIYVDKEVVATDAHYLYFEKVSEQVKQSYLLPPKVIKLMKIMIKGAIQPIDVHANENHIILKFDSATITFKKCDAKFPDYRTVIPTKHSTTIELDKKQFINRITKAIKYADETTWQITAIINEKLSIESCNLGYDKSYNSHIPICKDGINTTTAFNGKMMLRILNNIKTEKVVLKFTTPKEAIVIQDKFLLMPIIIFS